MKKKELDFNYNTFNRSRFLKQFKTKANQSIDIGRFRITGYHTKGIANNKSIRDLISTIIRNPIVFENDLIYIAIIEITSYMDMLTNFQKAIKEVNSIDGLKLRQESVFEKQTELISKLREISEKPTKAPDFVKKTI